MNLRAYAAIAAILFIVGVCGWAKLEHDRADREKAKRVTAEQTAQVATETTKIIDRTFTNERTVY